MKAITGELNTTCFVQFGVEIQGEQAGVWGGEKTLVKGSSSMQKGKFKTTNNDSFLQTKAWINYKDFTNNVQIILTENKLMPRTKIRIGLPDPEKLNVPEFSATGHFDIEAINVISAQKSFKGSQIMPQLIEGKKVNLLDKLYFERIGEPLVQLNTIVTSLGAIEQIRQSSKIEI